MTSGTNMESIVAKLNDAGIQARIRSAVRKATLSQLKSEGIELTPQQWGELMTRSTSSARSGTDVLAGIGIAILVGL